MATTVQRWRKRATAFAFMIWLLAAVVVDSRWNSIYSPFFFAAGCLLVGVGVLGRVWCLVCIAGFKNEELITDGPYSLCRNPLYLFSLLATIGVGLGSCTFAFPAVAILGFAVWYPGVIAFEARNLAQRHGEAYRSYVAKTPALLPLSGNFHEDSEHTVRSASFRRGLFDTIWFFALFVVMQLVYAMHQNTVLPTWYKLF